MQFHELRSVKTLDLSGNKLTTVEMVSRIRTCEHLNVARNSLTVLPEDIHHLKTLVTLDASGNFLKVRVLAVWGLGRGGGVNRVYVCLCVCVCVCVCV